MRRTSRCLSAVICLAFWVPVSVADEPPRTISVSGEGKASAPPDVATIQTGVVTQASEAAEALADNNRATQRVMDALKSHRIVAKDIQTSNFNIRPNYERTRNQRQPRIVGYSVTNQVQVRVRNLPSLGKVLDSLVTAGSNQMSGISFGIDDPTGVKNQARNRAVSDARDRAQLYAHAAGVKVGKVISISEQVAQVPRPAVMGRAFAAAEGVGSVPVATGEQEVRATVHMVFALID